MNATLTLSAESTAVRESSFGHRIFAVLRLHFVNPAAILWLPIVILATIFAGNWVIWWLIATYAGSGDALEGTQWSGASMFIFVYMMVVAIQAMNLTFQYALGMGVTRRDYYLGSALTFVTLAAGWAVVLGVLGAIEEATGGWGLGGRMFSSIYFGDDGALARFWYVFVLFLFFLFMGSLSGALFVRWKGIAVTLLWVGLGIVLVAGAALVTVTSSWGAVGSAFATVGFAGAMSLSLVLTVVAGLCAYLVLRKATPRS